MFSVCLWLCHAHQDDFATDYCLINDAVLDGFATMLKSFLQALSLNVFVYDAFH